MCCDVATTQIRCKGRYKKSTPEKECKNSANYAKTLQNQCKFSASKAKILRLIIHSCPTKIAGRKVKFGLKAVKDDGSFCVRGILI